MNETALYTTAGVILAALFGALGSAYQARTKTKADIGQSITAGFKELTDQLQEERDKLGAIIDAQRAQIDTLRATIDSLFNSADDLRREIRKWKHHSDTLGDIMRAHKVEVPGPPLPEQPHQASPPAASPP